MLDKIKEFIEDMIIFHGLTEEELGKLIDKLEIKTYPKNQTICAEGDMGKELYVILSGKVEVLKKDKNGVEHQIITMKHKDSFGEMTLIDIQKRSATVRTIEDTMTASLSFANLAKIYFEDVKMYTKIILNIAREFSRRLRKMDVMFAEYFHLDLNDISKGEKA